MKTRRIESGNFPFVTYHNARRGVYNNHKRRLMALQGDTTLTDEQREQKEQEISREYREELSQLLKKYELL